MKEKNENSEVPDLSTLSFLGLQATYEKVDLLAETTFHRIENGFENAKGDRITIYLNDPNPCRLCMIDLRRSRDIYDAVNRYLTVDGTVLTKGGHQEELLLAIRKMLEDLGCRIIE